MYTNNLHLFIKFFFISTILPHIISSTNISSTNMDPRYNDCTPFISNCGFQLKISYPFWDNRVPSYCGHPNFKLNCKSNSSLTISIQNQDYNILAIDYESQIFTISKPQLINGPCPNQTRTLTNTTLDLNLLTFSSDTQNATLFYHCQLSTLGEGIPYGFSCPMNNDTTYFSSNSSLESSTGYMAINRTWEEKLREKCGFEIYIPILRTLGQELAKGNENINNVLSQGFDVKWMIDEGNQCQKCSNSGGRCGYNQSLKELTCFCQDGAYDVACGIVSASPSKGKKSIQGTIIVALGIGLGVCLLSSILCFLLYRIYHKKDLSKKFRTHGKSYNTSISGSNFPILNGSTYFGVHVFNYKDIEQATDYFSPSKELGEGGFGTVYYGKLQDGREVAIKRLYENNSKRAEQFLNEVEILANLRHKNLVTLYGCTSCRKRELLLIYEYVPNGTVADHLHGSQSKQSPLPWSTRLNIAIETASALLYLHTSDIIHRDVKTQNILLDHDSSVKVADFGLSRLFPLDVTHVSTAPQGTPGYVDPEYHQCYHLTEKSDVYSFGVVVAELISSLPAVDITRKRHEINLSNLAINKIQDGVLNEFVDPSLGFESDFVVKREITGVSELMFHCLQSTKEMRPSMHDVLKRLLAIKHQQGSEVDSAEVLSILSDDVIMLKGDLSPGSPQRDDYLGIRYYKPNASV